MEGFVSTNSAFEQMRHNNNYADYGAGKINKTREQNSKQNPPIKQTYSKTNSAILGNTADDFRDAFTPEFIDSAIYSPDKTIVDTITTDKNDKKHNIRKFVIIGGSVALLSGITLLSTKGKSSKKIASYISKIIDKTNVKIDKLKQREDLSNKDGLYLFVLQRMNKGLSRARGTFYNISPFKDVLFEKTVREKLKLGKVCDAITSTFKKISFGTVKSYYKKASANMDEMTSLFEATNKKIADGHYGVVDPDKLSKADKKISGIKTTYAKYFSEDKLVERSDEVSKKFKGLGGRIYNKVYGNFKDFLKNIDGWTTFISEKFVANDKEVIVDNLDSMKNVITCTPKDIHTKLNGVINELEQTISNNPDSRKTIKRLKELSKQYIDASGSTESKSRAKVVEEIQSIITKNTSESSPQTELFVKIEKLLSQDKKGQIEELLTYYKEILPRDEYEALKKTAQKAIKSLNNAVYNEGQNYTDKLRDLSVGSALTDVAIGMGVPILTTGIAVSAADTKEQKRSVMLKYGVPLMVGVATASTCALRLIAGGKALILGIITSTITNNICERIDNKLKSKKQPENS